MNAVVPVSQHAAARKRTVGDRPVQLLQVRFLLAVIPEALVRFLVVRANSLMWHVSHVIELYPSPVHVPKTSAVKVNAVMAPRASHLM